MADVNILGVGVPAIAILFFIRWIWRKSSEGVDKVVEQKEKMKLEMEATRKVQAQTYQRQWNQVDDLIRGHAQTLSDKRSSMLKTDDYGVVDSSTWAQEKSYFASRVINQGLGESALPMNEADLVKRIDDVLDVDGF